MYLQSLINGIRLESWDGQHVNITLNNTTIYSLTDGSPQQFRNNMKLPYDIRFFHCMYIPPLKFASNN